MGQAILTRKGGGGGSDIENSKIETSKALELIKANNFIQKTIDLTIEQGAEEPRKYTFPGTNYKLIEPRVRSFAYGLSVSSSTKSTTVKIQVEHPDGTIKDVISINDMLNKTYGGRLAQVIPVSANSFIAVYAWGTNTYNSFSTYYGGDRHVAFVVYELDSTMSTATLALGETELPFVGATAYKEYSSGVRENYPYCGMAITATFPTKFDKCFVLAVYRYATWASNTASSPQYCGTLIFCDYSRGTMTMTQNDLGQMAIFADVNEYYVNSLSESMAMIMNGAEYQPYNEDGIYEQIVVKHSVDSSQSEYTAGIYFLRFEILSSSKHILLYPATFIKSLASGDAAYPNSSPIYALVDSTTNEDGTKSLCYMSLINVGITQRPNNHVKIMVELLSDGYVNEVSWINLGIQISTTGKYGAQLFTVNDTNSTGGYVKIKMLAIIDGIAVGILTNENANYYQNSLVGILPMYYAVVNKDMESVTYNLIGFATISNYASKLNSFAGDLYGFTSGSFANTVLGANYVNSNNNKYLVSIKDFVAGIKKAISGIDGISKETSQPGEAVKIAVLKV